MSKEDYRALIDDLCKYGILTEEDKNYVGYSNVVPLDFSEPVAEISPCFQPFSTNDFSFFSGGNALEWADYRSKFETYDPVTQSYRPSRRALLMDTIADVLAQID